jgi:hypothetical protein
MVQGIFCIVDVLATARPPLGVSTSLPFRVKPRTSDLEGVITDTHIMEGIFSGLLPKMYLMPPLVGFLHLLDASATDPGPD